MSVTNASEGNADGGSTGTIPRQATFFDRLSILVLAIDWTIFGSMHFSLLKETTEMLPGWVPEAYKPLIVTSTGMIEVATGILILLRVTRWWAAAVIAGSVDHLHSGRLLHVGTRTGAGRELLFNDGIPRRPRAPQHLSWNLLCLFAAESRLRRSSLRRPRPDFPGISTVQASRSFWWLPSCCCRTAPAFSRSLLACPEAQPLRACGP